MKEKKKYEKPVVKTEQVTLGVFGDYSGDNGNENENVILKFIASWGN